MRTKVRSLMLGVFVILVFTWLAFFVMGSVNIVDIKNLNVVEDVVIVKPQFKYKPRQVSSNTFLNIFLHCR